jgi:hypothetical protein
VSRPDRLRWWIARQLDRLPGQCWYDLHVWAVRGTPRTTPWSPLSPGCGQDAAEDGVCACGKLRREAVAHG